MAQMVKNLPAMREAPGLIPGLEWSLGEGTGNLLQCSCLENPMDRGAWWAMVHGRHKESDMTEQLTLSLLFSAGDRREDSQDIHQYHLDIGDRDGCLLSTPQIAGSRGTGEHQQIHSHLGPQLDLDHLRPPPEFCRHGWALCFSASCWTGK